MRNQTQTSVLSWLSMPIVLWAAGAASLAHSQQPLGEPQTPGQQPAAAGQPRQTGQQPGQPPAQQPPGQPGQPPQGRMHDPRSGGQTPRGAGGAGLQPKQAPAAAIATVNGEPITQWEFDGHVQSTLNAQAAGPQGQPASSPMQVQHVHQSVLNTLIEARLIEQYMRDQGPKVEKPEVDQVLKGFQESLQAQGTTLENYLATNSMSLDDFLKRIEGSVAWQKYQQETMTPENLRSFYEDQRQRFGESSFEEVQPQINQLYSRSIWDSVVKETKPKAEIELSNRAAALQPSDSQPAR